SVFSRHCCATFVSRLTATVCLFFFSDTAPPEICTLSLHDALPIFGGRPVTAGIRVLPRPKGPTMARKQKVAVGVFTEADRHLLRSEEHTSELQALTNFLCRLLLEKKKNPAGTTPPRMSYSRSSVAD